MHLSCLIASQPPLIHLLPYTAPKPISEASVYNWISAVRIWPGSGIMDDDFHSGKHLIHHWMSHLDSLLRVMWWCWRFTVVVRSTFATKDNTPGRFSPNLYHVPSATHKKTAFFILHYSHKFWCFLVARWWLHMNPERGPLKMSIFASKWANQAVTLNFGKKWLPRNST